MLLIGTPNLKKSNMRIAIDEGHVHRTIDTPDCERSDCSRVAEELSMVQPLAI